MEVKEKPYHDSSNNLRYKDEVYTKDSTDGTGKKLVGICPIRPFRREFLSGNHTDASTSSDPNEVTCTYSNLDTERKYTLVVFTYHDIIAEIKIGGDDITPEFWQDGEPEESHGYKWFKHSKWKKRENKLNTVVHTFSDKQQLEIKYISKTLRKWTTPGTSLFTSNENPMHFNLYSIFSSTAGGPFEDFDSDPVFTRVYGTAFHFLVPTNKAQKLGLIAGHYVDNYFMSPFSRDFIQHTYAYMDKDLKKEIPVNILQHQYYHERCMFHDAFKSLYDTPSMSVMNEHVHLQREAPDVYFIIPYKPDTRFVFLTAQKYSSQNGLYEWAGQNMLTHVSVVNGNTGYVGIWNPPTETFNFDDP